VVGLNRVKAILARRNRLQIRTLVTRRENSRKLAWTEQDARAGRPNLYPKSRPGLSLRTLRTDTMRIGIGVLVMVVVALALAAGCSHRRPTPMRVAPTTSPSASRSAPAEQLRITDPRVNARKKAELFVDAARRGDWGTVNALLDPDPSTTPISEIKQYRDAFLRFPPSSEWVAEVSPHDASYIVVTIRVRKDLYSIVVNPRGVNKFFPGSGD